MATGFCPAVLLHLKDIAMNGYPGQKVTPPGFTNMLYTAPNRPNLIQQAAFTNGHRRTANIKYKVRTTENYVNTTESCDIDLTPAYKETSVTVDNVVQIGLHIPDDTVRQYCEDASRMVSFGTPPTAIMAEVMDSILHAMNGLYQKMDKVLLTAMASAFGKNKRTGSAASTNINFALDSSTNNFSQNVARILADTQENEFCGTPLIVGNGNFHVWDLQKSAGALTYNQAGVNNTMVMPYQFFYDPYSATQWGDNQIGVFAPDAVHIIEDNRNVGSFAGQKGASFFTQFADPRTQCWTPNGIGNIMWDVHFKYIDCPTTLNNGYAGGTATYQRGWALYISKYYQLFTTPTDAYDGADVIAGQNGTLRYTIQNA